MPSDDFIILQHSCCLASLAIKREFRDLISGDLLPPESTQAPYAAAIAIWLRLPTDEQQRFRVWMNDHVEQSGPHFPVTPPSTQLSSLVRHSATVANCERSSLAGHHLRAAKGERAV